MVGSAGPLGVSGAGRARWSDDDGYGDVPGVPRELDALLAAGGPSGCPRDVRGCWWDGDGDGAVCPRRAVAEDRAWG